MRKILHTGALNLSLCANSPTVTIQIILKCVMCHMCHMSCVSQQIVQIFKDKKKVSQLCLFSITLFDHKSKVGLGAYLVKGEIQLIFLKGCSFWLSQNIFLTVFWLLYERLQGLGVGGMYHNCPLVLKGSFWSFLVPFFCSLVLFQFLYQFFKFCLQRFQNQSFVINVTIL